MTRPGKKYYSLSTINQIRCPGRHLVLLLLIQHLEVGIAVFL